MDLSELPKRVSRKMKITCLIVVFLFLINRFIFTIFIVNGNSMFPTFNHLDQLMINKWVREFYQGDIVIFDEHGVRYIKRITALPEQEIFFEQDTNRLFIDRIVIENCCEEDTYLQDINPIFFEPIKVPENSFFVMGDNILNSIDSRVLGFIHKDQIIGRVVFQYWPHLRRVD